MKAVGIDLGTTFSCLAVLNDYGKPEIIPNSEGERHNPSVIMFDSENQFTVGTIAKNSAVADPDNVVEFVKGRWERRLRIHPWREGVSSRGSFSIDHQEACDRCTDSPGGD